MPARGGEDGGTANCGAERKTRYRAAGRDGVVTDGQEKGGVLPTVIYDAGGKRAV